MGKIFFLPINVADSDARIHAVFSVFTELVFLAHHETQRWKGDVPLS